MITISHIPENNPSTLFHGHLGDFDPDRILDLSSEREVLPSGAMPLIVGPGISFEAAVARYVTEVVSVRRTPRGQDFVTSLLRSCILPAFGARPLNQITRSDIRELLRVIGTTRPKPYKGAPSRGREGRANSCFTFLHQFFGWASDEEGGDLLEIDPCSAVHTPFRYRERERTLTGEEIRWLWTVTEGMGQIGTIARLLLLTAQRRSEVADAYGGQIDWNARTLILPIRTTKPQRGHIVPLSTMALELLEEVPHGDARDLLFPNRKGGPITSSRFRDANCRLHARMVELQREEITRSGGDPSTAFIPWFCFHDLRRSAATLMCQLGHSVDVVDKVLNHANGKTGTGRVHNLCTRIYIRHEFMKERAAALQSLGEFIRKLVGCAT